MKYLFLLVALVLAGLYGFNLFYDDTTEASRDLTALEAVGEKCMSIRDRATANVVPIVEFQKLELESRRANVLSNCMGDHGYLQNPAWSQYALPSAKAEASKQNISQDEALEHLRRIEMLNFAATSDIPFWVKSKKPNISE